MDCLVLDHCGYLKPNADEGVHSSQNLPLDVPVVSFHVAFVGCWTVLFFAVEISRILSLPDRLSALSN